jgi:2-keto-3-deoxy-6-phosphogluconate aldolase
VSGYELGVYMLGASEPFTTVAMGKPSPGADGKIRYNFSSGVAGWPLPGGNYEARVRAVGPEGSAVSGPSNPFTFTTGSACAVTLSATTARVPATGGAYTVDVSTGAGCQWAVSSSLPWVTLWSSGGSGSGTAPFDVQPNASSSSRTGTITIGGKTLTLTQDAASTPRTTPVLTWPTPSPITAGTPLGATQLNATANVPGSFVYTPAAGTILAAGTYTLRVTFTPADTTRYNTATASRTLVVNAATKLTPYISWATPAAIAQGTPLSATQLNAAAKFAGTFVYSPPAGTVLAAGTHTLSVIFTPADTSLYNTATASRSLVVNAATKITPYISWATPAAITQGTPLSATQLNAVAKFAGSFVYSPPAGTVLAAGTHTLSVRFTPADTTLYNTATASRTLVVNPPPF